MAVFGSVKEKVIGKIVQIEVDAIKPNPLQPRRNFDENELYLLAESIRQNGIIHPLSVRRLKNGVYELVAGERRLRAAKIIGMESVPCVIADVNERSSAIMALVENIQRADLSYFDEAFAIAKLIELYGMTQEDAAIKLGKAQSTIANKLRLLRFSEDEMTKITSYGLTERHARCLLRIDDIMLRDELIEIIFNRKLNVEKTEELVESYIFKKNENEKFKKRCVVLKDVRLFVNTINRAIETMRAAGIMAEASKKKSEHYIEYVVKIPVDK